MQEADHASFDFSSTSAIDIGSLSEEELRTLLNRREAIEAYQRAPKSKANAVKAARLIDMSVSQFYRILDEHKRLGNLGALLPKRSDGGAGKARIDPRVEVFIQRALVSFLRNKPGHDIDEFVDDAITALKKAKLPQEHWCSRRTIRRRFESLPEKQKVAHWEGRATARDQFRLKAGSTPDCLYPLQRVQIDHTLADIWLTCETDGTVIGRPWVTMAIDEFSRSILAIWVTFRHPNVEELAAAITLAAMPKDRWLRQYGMEHIDWPMSGLTSGFYSDWAKEFQHTAANTALLAWGGKWEFRTATHYGGIIESLVKTAMSQTRRLEGNTIRSNTERTADTINPAMTAKLTRADFTAELIKYFGETYHHRVHPATGMRPIDKWNLGCLQNGDPPKLGDASQFYVDMLPTIKPSLQKYGFREAYLEYRHPDLAELLAHAKSVRFDLKIAPADVTRAFVRHPIKKIYLELHSDPLDVAQPVTRDEWLFHKKKCREAAGRYDPICRRTIVHSINTGRLLADEAAYHGVAGSKPGPSRNHARRADNYQHIADTSELFAVDDMVDPRPPLAPRRRDISGLTPFATFEV